MYQLKKKVSYSEFINAKRTLERNPKSFVKEMMTKTIQDYENTKGGN